MKVKRVICSMCESERQVTSDVGNKHEYSEDIVYELCDKPECQARYDAPDQKLLRAIFGEKVNG